MVKEFATFASLQATADAATSLAIGRPAFKPKCKPVTKQQPPGMVLVEAGLAVQFQMKAWPLHTFISP